MLYTQAILKHACSFEPLVSRAFSVSAYFNKSIPLSYLPKPEALKSEFIIGWTPEQDKVDPRTFIENTKFVDFMTSVLKKNVHKVNDSNLKAMADWQKEGWLHIGDERNPPAWGRINYPEDIIGSVELDHGKIKEGSYQPMPAHRLITNSGLFQLSEPLTKCVVEAAKKAITS
ncbi:hypothetical protein INT46_002573 [Mucor plumbeus]|uniref:Uncharacterized protein n=1 Tax=Mucor plumbeus TaxID=97098 RepID=A0A8H7QSZ9_9FUNG|nr:hypothetical protein INT46_002573 [Mucor plumbeus]